MGDSMVFDLKRGFGDDNAEMPKSQLAGNRLSRLFPSRRGKGHPKPKTGAGIPSLLYGKPVIGLLAFAAGGNILRCAAS